MHRSPTLFLTFVSVAYTYWVYAKWAIIAVVGFYAIRIAWWLLVMLRRLFINHRLADVDTMSGEDFEKYVCGVLRMQGYSGIRLTEKYDYGVDIIASKDGIRWGIQVKRYSGLVKASAVRQVVTGLSVYNCDRAMVITNSVFSRVAVELAFANNCILIDRDKLSSVRAYS
jgi:restriction system protein